MRPRRSARARVGALDARAAWRPTTATADGRDRSSQRRRPSGGRGYLLIHGGTFTTLKEARLRRDVIAGELAAARNPRLLLEAMTAPTAPELTFAEWAERYRESRIDFAQETTKNMTSHLKALNEVFADHDPAAITVADVQSRIGASKLKPSSLRRYLATLRAVLDFVGLEENVARDPRVRLPREEATVVDPPSAAEVEAIVANSPPRAGSPCAHSPRPECVSARRTGSSGRTWTWPARASASATGRPRPRDAGSRCPRR